MTEGQTSRLTHTPEPPSAHELAAQLAGKLCHDLVAPTGALINGLDMLEDPDTQSLHDDAIALISASARKLSAALTFARVAYGTSTGAETFDARALETMTRDVMDGGRVELDWAIAQDGLPKLAARAVLNLVRIGAASVAIGGVVRANVAERDGETEVLIRAEGPRPALRPEAKDGLAGLPLDGRLAGHWVQAFYIRSLIDAAGGALELEEGEGAVVIRARFRED